MVPFNPHTISSDLAKSIHVEEFLTSMEKKDAMPPESSDSFGCEIWIIQPWNAEELVALATACGWTEPQWTDLPHQSQQIKRWAKQFVKMIEKQWLFDQKFYDRSIFLTIHQLEVWSNLLLEGVSARLSRSRLK